MSLITICRKSEVIIRRALRESGGKKLKKFSSTYLLNMVLTNLFHSTSLFQELMNDHCNDQTDYSNHSDTIHLIRATANKYITIRLHYIGSKIMERPKRQKLNKLILFEGQ